MDQYCIICGKPLPRTKTGEINQRRKVCSEECRKAYRKQWRQEKFANDPQYRKDFYAGTVRRAQNKRKKLMGVAALNVIDMARQGATEGELAEYMYANLRLRVDHNIKRLQVPDVKE